MRRKPPTILSTIIIRTLGAVVLAGVFGVGVAKWGADGQGTLIAAVAGAIAGGVIGNHVDRLMCQGSDALANTLTIMAEGGARPANHDLARAIRRSVLQAALIVAREAARAELECHDASDRTAWEARRRTEVFTRDIASQIIGELKRLGSRDNDARLTDQTSWLADNLVDLVRPQNGGPMSPSALSAWRETASALCTEFQAAGVRHLPSSFGAAMANDGPNNLSWSELVRCLFMEIVKNDTAVFRVVQIQLMLSAGR